MKTSFATILKTACSITFLPLLFFALAAQAQQNIPQPHQNRKVDFTSTPELIVYIAIPVAAILLYFFLKRKRNRDQKRQ